MCPETDVVSQIDRVVINKRHASSITDVKLCRGPNYDSDHFIVKTMLRERLSNAHKNRGRKRWTINKLINEEDFNLYQQKINEKLEDTDGIQDVQIEWNTLKNVIIEAAKESLNENKGKRNEEWFDEERRTAVQGKSNMKKLCCRE
jgi:hypothetical protein